MNIHGANETLKTVFRRFFFCVLMVSLTNGLTGCGSNYLSTDSQPLITPEQLPQKLVSISLLTQSTPLYAWIPQADKQSDTLRIYIEGDGRAWLSRGRASLDPTPENRLVHRLMLQDSKADIAYLARPCQFNNHSSCSQELWTFKRYDPDTLNLINEGIRFIKNNGAYQSLELVGYSGGATIALLLASQRDDVTSVRTLAGNLDPEFTNRLHRVSSMPSALNPTSFSKQLTEIPQLHFIGAEDRVIPAVVFQKYRGYFKQVNCLNKHVVDGATHSRGWQAHWKKLLQIQPGCFNKKISEK